VVRITSYIRPHQLEEVKSAIAALGISGLTVTDVRGRGNSKETTGLLGGDDRILAYPIRSRVTVVAHDDLVEEIIDAIIENARTGEPGDGKIFVERVSDAVRIRTSERGDSAV
jgi:nitrogen regulatory protein P-II 1